MKIQIPAFLSTHGKEIIFGGCLAGMWGGAITAVIATPKAVDEFKKASTKKEKLLVLTKHYSPAFAIMALSTGGLISVLVSKNKEIAGLALACAASEKLYSEYRQSVVDTVGEKKEIEIQDNLATKKVQETAIPETIKESLLIADDSSVLCQDLWTGRYFKSTRQKIDSGLNEANAQLNDDGYLSLNDFYYFIGLDSVVGGVELGWSISNGTIKLEYTSSLKEGNVPVLAFRFSTHPTINYDRYA